MGPFAQRPLLPIARHAKELIEHSSEHLQGGSEKDLIIALVHIDNAVEILLKEHLRFDKNVSWRKIEDKFFPQLLDDCVSDLDALENNKSQFIAFHDIRNALYHAGTFAPRKDDVESAIYFTKLLFNELHPEFAFKELKVKATPKDTIRFLAKEFGRDKPYATEVGLTNKIASLMRRHGYVVALNPMLGGTSRMADMLLTKGNKIIVVEVKARTTGKRVLNSSVYQLAGYVAAVKQEKNSEVEGWLVTNENFSSVARKAAEKLEIRLISGSELKRLLSGESIRPYFF